MRMLQFSVYGVENKDGDDDDYMERMRGKRDEGKEDAEVRRTRAGKIE